MLILQDANENHRHAGIVCDSHVATALVTFSWSWEMSLKKQKWPIPKTMLMWLQTLFKTSACGKIAGKWMECIASPRQLWTECWTHKWMNNLAKELGCHGTFQAVVARDLNRKIPSACVASRSVPFHSVFFHLFCQSRQQPRQQLQHC